MRFRVATAGELLLQSRWAAESFLGNAKVWLQLAPFLPAILACPSFELTAHLRWGVQRKEKTLLITDADGLTATRPDRGQYLPPELAMFAGLFRKKIDDWDLTEEGEIFRLGNHYWVPDFRLTEHGTGRVVYLEVLGFWRRSSLESYLERLRRDASRPFILAVSDQLHVEEDELARLPCGSTAFTMPLPDEIARLARKPCGRPRMSEQEHWRCCASWPFEIWR